MEGAALRSTDMSFYTRVISLLLSHVIISSYLKDDPSISLPPKQHDINKKKPPLSKSPLYLMLRFLSCSPRSVQVATKNSTFGPKIKSWKSAQFRT